MAPNRKRRSLSRFTMSPSLSRSPSPAPRNNNRAGRSPLGRRHGGASPINRPGRNGKGEEADRKKDPEKDTLHTRRRRRSRDASLTSSSHSVSPGRRKEKTGRFTDDLEKSWTPPLRAEDHPLVVGDNFKVVVKNSVPSKEKKEKRDKKRRRKEREEEKRREADREREKRREKKKSKKDGKGGPSKEVFASGDNILVSVNFSSKRAAEEKAAGGSNGSGGGNSKPPQTTIVTLPPSKDQIVTQKQRREKAAAAAAADKAQVVEVRSKSGASSGKSRRGQEKETLVVTKNRRHRKVDAKPVAIIDLDGSPFRVMTPSPKAVIVLSDSDGEGGGGGEGRKKRKKHVEEKQPRNERVSATASAPAGREDRECGGVKKRPTPVVVGDPIRLNSDDDDEVMEIDRELERGLRERREAVPEEENSNSGPKTPPLPPTMKFSMAMRSKGNLLRTVNPLHDAREAEEEEQEEQQQQRRKEQEEKQKKANEENGSGGGGGELMEVSSDKEKALDSNSVGVLVGDQQQQQQQGSGVNNSSNNNNNNKIGPNTPPEPAPTSPDAYDPFEPTKSNSVSPAQDDDSNGEADSVKSKEEQPSQQQLPMMQHKKKIPDLVMKLLNSTAGHHPGLHHGHHTGSSGEMIGSLSPPPPPPPYLEKSLERGGLETHSKGIQILSNVVIQQGKGVDGQGVSSSGGVGGKSLKNTAAFSTMNSTTTSYSIMKQMQTDAKRMLYAKQKAAPPSVTTSTDTTCTPTLTQAMLKKHNAECKMMDIAAESPYSPGSGDFEDLFEPPSQSERVSGGGGPSPMKAPTKNQAELFDNLFGSHSPPTMGTKWTPTKARKPTTGTGRNSVGQNSRRTQSSRSKWW